MFNNAFLDLEPPINELDLDQLEKEYSFSMPIMIRNHILKYNGGYLKKMFLSTMTAKHIQYHILFL
jgi:hypothetical protein